MSGVEEKYLRIRLRSGVEEEELRSGVKGWVRGVESRKKTRLRDSGMDTNPILVDASDAAKL